MTAPKCASAWSSTPANVHLGSMSESVDGGSRSVRRAANVLRALAWEVKVFIHRLTKSSGGIVAPLLRSFYCCGIKPDRLACFLVLNAAELNAALGNWHWPNIDI